MEADVKWIGVEQSRMVQFYIFYLLRPKRKMPLQTALKIVLTVQLLFTKSKELTINRVEDLRSTTRVN